MRGPGRRLTIDIGTRATLGPENRSCGVLARLVHVAALLAPLFQAQRLAILDPALETFAMAGLATLLQAFSVALVDAFLEAIGTEGRAAYQTMHTTTDFAFPLIYGLFLFALLSRLTIKQQLPLWLPWMALVATIADLVENFTLMRLTSHYPDFQPGLAHLAQVATIIKFAFIVLSAACLLWGLCRSLIHRRS